MDEVLEQRARQMWMEDVAGLTIGGLLTWETLGEDYLGRRIRAEYMKAARRDRRQSEREAIAGRRGWTSRKRARFRACSCARCWLWPSSRSLQPRGEKRST